MQTFSIILVRDNRNLNGFLSQNTFSTDGLAAINSITDTKDAQIINESEGEVEISYKWMGREPIWSTEE